MLGSERHLGALLRDATDIIRGIIAFVGVERLVLVGPLAGAVLTLQNPEVAERKSKTGRVDWRPKLRVRARRRPQGVDRFLRARILQRIAIRNGQTLKLNARRKGHAAF